MLRSHVFLFVLLLFPTGYLESAQTPHEVIVNFGEDVDLNCKFQQQLEVVQVTWHKEGAKMIQNVGTYNERYGPVINPPFKGKVEFRTPGLHNSSIVVRNVTQKDECCYKCLFITFPHKDISEKHCIKVHELYEPNLLTTPTNNSKDNSSVSCSATGRPAPIVTWDIPEHLPLLNSSTVHVPQPNGTITVISTVSVEVVRDTWVKCVASQPPGGSSKEASRLISVTDQTFVPNEHVDKVTQRKHLLIIPACATFLVAVVILVLVLWKTRKSSNNSCKDENIVTPT